MFHELALCYDRLLGDKDTAAEVLYLEALARRYGRAGVGSWLDVGCGTGRHLEILRRRHRVVGIDSSPEMLRIARGRLRGCRLVRGDMRNFELHAKFDVVSCLYSAIGHLRSEVELGRAFARFAHHLRPGGVCLVEPWIAASDFRPGYVQLVAYTGPLAPLARMGIGRRVGNRSIVRYEYLLGDSRRGIRHVVEEVEGLLVERDRLQGLMAGAGLAPKLLPRGLTPGRGMLIGQKPPAS